MRTIFLTLTSLAVFALPASALEVTTTPSDEFLEKLEGDYGMRELEFLQARVEKTMLDAFEGADVTPASITVEIVDAKPNKPTFQQLTDNPSLDFSGTFSIGGADLIATAYDAAGEEIGVVEYDWYESNLRNVVGNSTWTDANRAIRRLSSKISKEVADAGTS